MNPYQSLLVTSLIEDLRKDAAMQRMLPAKPSLRSRAASALQTAREAIATPAPSTATPTLTDYPYRS